MEIETLKAMNEGMRVVLCAALVALCVAISGDTIAVGASGGLSASAGKAYVFVRSGTTRTQQQRLVAGNSAVEKQGQARQKRLRLQWEAETVGTITSFNRAAKAGMTVAFH